jgi:ParB family chromosome partitioning protein
LRALNYRNIVGRPKEGEKALGPALAVAIGVSTRYVRKVLQQRRSGETGEIEEKIRNSVPNFQKLRVLRRIEAALEELISLPESEQLTRAEQSLYKAVPTFLKKLKTSIDEENKMLRQK